MERLINGLLIDSLNRTIERCSKIKTKAQEPDFVADLTLNWSKDLLQILEKFFNSYFEFNLASVYCHQKPIVDIKTKSKPELGDLLFVVKYIDKEKNEYFNSLLLQAKMSESSRLEIDKTESHQLALYMKWPKFKYYRANGLNGEIRNIYPKTITQGAKYLLINPKYGFGCAIPNNHLIYSKNFANEILDFLTFNSGRTFSNKNDITEDWSKMIWDLLKISKGIMSRRKNSGLYNFPRNSSNEFCLINENKKDFFFEDIESLVDEKNEDSGISTIMIEIKENEKKR